MTEVVTIPFSICVGGEDAIWLVVGWLMCDDVTMGAFRNFYFYKNKKFLALITILITHFLCFMLHKTVFSVDGGPPSTEILCFINININYINYPYMYVVFPF